VAKSGHKGARARAAERRSKALELRKAGASYRQIGAQLDVSMAQAHRDVTRAIANLAKLSEGDAEALRILEEQRLDGLFLSVWSQARAGDLQAIDRCLRIMARRAKLMGLNAPAEWWLSGKDGAPLIPDVVRIIEYGSDDGDGA